MKSSAKVNPWTWIPTLYFAQGIPFIFINMVTMVLFTQLGMSETDAALYTGWLYLPWVIKHHPHQALVDSHHADMHGYRPGRHSLHTPPA